MVKGVAYKDAEGNEVKCAISNAYTWSGKSRISVKVPKDAPASAKFEIETYEKTEKRNMPFKIENLKVR